MPFKTDTEMAREVAIAKKDEHHQRCSCEFSKVLEASRRFCVQATPENRRALHDALVAYDEAKNAPHG